MDTTEDAWGMDLGSENEWEDQGDLSSDHNETRDDAQDEHPSYTESKASSSSSSSGQRPRAPSMKKSPALTFLDPMKHETKVREMTLKNYSILSEEELRRSKAKVIKQMAELLFIDYNDADCLLRHYQWNVNSVQHDWFKDYKTSSSSSSSSSSADQQQHPRVRLGLTSSFQLCTDQKTASSPSSAIVGGSPSPSPSVFEPTYAFPPSSASSSSFVLISSVPVHHNNAQLEPVMIQCSSAYCELVPHTHAYALSCGHWFCGDCWTGFLMTEVESGASCVFTTCMGLECKQMVPETVFVKFIQDKDLLRNYHRWLLNSFVEGHPELKWCPNPQCDSAVRFNLSGAGSAHAFEVFCTCGCRFCFSCNIDAHTPAPCDVVRKWMQKEASDDATSVWLKARTKECPNCAVRIEKNKACNHMSCTHCGHHFCWLCKGPWKEHGTQTGGYYACNKYNDSASSGGINSEEKEAMDSNVLLQKYTYYYKRYRSNLQGVELTREELKPKIERKMRMHDISTYAFILEAIDGLIDARSVLQWTHAVSYYLAAGATKNLFEYQQQMLTEATEFLQDIMETNTAEKLLSLRSQIVDKMASIQKFRQEMVKQVNSRQVQDALRSEADTSMTMWGCSNCKVDNQASSMMCVVCSACKTHGEPDCKACKAGQKRTRTRR